MPYQTAPNGLVYFYDPNTGESYYVDQQGNDAGGIAGATTETPTNDPGTLQSIPEITGDEGTLEAALQSVIAAITAQQNQAYTTAETQEAQATAGSELNIADLEQFYRQQRENQEKDLSQTTESQTQTLEQAIQSALFSRDTGLASAETRASQTTDSANLTLEQVLRNATTQASQRIGTGEFNLADALRTAETRASQTTDAARLRRDQTIGAGELNLEQSLTALQDFLSKGLQNIGREETEGLRRVTNDALDRGIFRSGIRQASEGRVQETAEVGREQIQLDFNRETEAAGAKFQQLSEFADQSFQLQAAQALENLENAKIGANGAFDLLKQQVQETLSNTQASATESRDLAVSQASETLQNSRAALESAYSITSFQAQQDAQLAIQFAQEDFILAINQIGELENQAILREEYDLANSLADISLQYQNTFNALATQAAQEQADLTAVQAQLETTQATTQSAPAPTSSTSTAGTTSYAQPAVEPYYPPGASVPSGGSTIDALRAAAGIPGYTTGDIANIEQQVAAYTAPTYSAGPAVSSPELTTALRDLDPIVVPTNVMPTIYEDPYVRNR